MNEAEDEIIFLLKGVHTIIDNNERKEVEIKLKKNAMADDLSFSSTLFSIIRSGYHPSKLSSFFLGRTNLIHLKRLRSRGCCFVYEECRQVSI